MPIKNTQDFLKQAFQKALGAAKPSEILPASLDHVFKNKLSGRCLVLGAGKAAASMAATLEAYANKFWPDVQLEGMVVTRYGHATPTQYVKVVEASHPVPDVAGLEAAQKTLELIKTLEPNDQLIVLISGGGSSLLTLPAVGLSMDDLQVTTRALLRSGAPIAQMNVVRKHLSAILGGQMAREAAMRGAKVDAFLISDVTGDDISSIASGPCAPDHSSFSDALQILKEHDLLNGQIPLSVMEYLKSGSQGNHPETLRPMILFLGGCITTCWGRLMLALRLQQIIVVQWVSHHLSWETL